MPKKSKLPIKGALRTLQKNEQIFFAKIIKNNAEGYGLLKYVAEKYSRYPLFWMQDQAERLDAILNKEVAVSRANKIVGQWSPQKSVSFSRDIKALLKYFDFGKEWEDTFKILFTCGMLFVPFHNLHIEQENKRIHLTLNPDTSIEDVKASFSDIRKKQKEAWPDLKGIYITKKLSNKLHLQIRVLKEKGRELSTKEKYQNFTDYEEILLKQGYGIKAVKNYRKQTRSEKKKYGVKTKRSDEEVLSKITSIENKDKLMKAVNRFRKDKERIRKI